MSQISTYSYLQLAQELADTNPSLADLEALAIDTSNEAAARIRI
jgi:hypothetical protein